MTVKSQVVPKSTKVENIYSLCLKVLVFKNYFFFKIYINFFFTQDFFEKKFEKFPEAEPVWQEEANKGKKARPKFP